jgi:hypothetical protein
MVGTTAPQQPGLVNPAPVTLAQALEETKGSLRAVLLGNGFSIAYSRRFIYRNLYENATLSPRVHAIFDHLSTSDFEQVICWLQDNVALLGNFQAPDDLLERLANEVQAVRVALVEAISASHPPHVHVLDQSEKEQAARFIENFSLVFSVSYDLLLYWLKIWMNLDDGFRYYESATAPLRWDPDLQRQVYWLHGGFHLSDNDNGTFKSRYQGTQLIERLRSEIPNGFMPLVVAEGRSERKLERIREHSYLLACYDDLCAFEGVIFLFGLALQKQDDHIRDALAQGLSSLVYVGLFAGDDPANRAALIASASELPARRAAWRAARSLEPLPLEIRFYDSSTCDVWRPRGEPPKL